MSTRTFSSFAFGCRVTQAEKEALDADLLALGYDYNENEPGLHIVHTCAVTGKAEREVRQHIYRTKRQFPDTEIIATGCAATHWLKTGVRVEGVARMVGHGQRDTILSGLIAGEDSRTVPSAGPDVFGASGRVFVKIQDGCDRACSYCIVPSLRGRATTKSTADIVREINRRGENAAEIILTAINTEFFGRGTGETIPLLVDSILDQTRVPRISFGSVHPYSLTPEFVAWYGKRKDSGRMVRFLHVPIQSGCDRTLNRMRRGYRAAAVVKRLGGIQTADPDTFIGTDVIAGFPGETDDEFRECYDLLTKSPISRFHVFRYSRRSGTPSATAGDPEIPPAVKSKRAERLRQLSDRKYDRFRRRFIGQKMQCLFLARSDENGQEGLLINQLPVYVRGKIRHPGTTGELTVTGITDRRLVAQG